MLTIPVSQLRTEGAQQIRVTAVCRSHLGHNEVACITLLTGHLQCNQCKLLSVGHTTSLVVHLMVSQGSYQTGGISGAQRVSPVGEDAGLSKLETKNS